MTTYRYEIHPRPAELDRGWRLRPLEDDLEVGADRDANPRRGLAWFNALSETERAHWLAMARNARPVDARGTYLSQKVLLAAQEESRIWMTART
ncbi:hypothetical protein [Cupriavidus necator]